MLLALPNSPSSPRSSPTASGLRRLGLLVAALLATANPGAAQGPLTLEFRGGWSIPVGDFAKGPESGGAMSTGRSFGARFGLERTPSFDLLLGFSQCKVDCSLDGCGGDEEWVSTQWELGLRWKGPVASIRPWVSVAAVVPKVERDRPTGTVSSTVVVGAEIGVGALFQLADRWFLTPGVRYSSYSPDFKPTGNAPMRWAVVQMGLLISF